LKYTLLSLSFDCWEVHACTFEGGELPVGKKQIAGVVEQKRTAENSKAEPGLQGLGSGLGSPVFL